MEICSTASPAPACLVPQDVELADRFFAGHRAPGKTPFPYPRDLFLRFIQENDGGRENGGQDSMIRSVGRRRVCTHRLAAAPFLR